MQKFLPSRYLLLQYGGERNKYAKEEKTASLCYSTKDLEMGNYTHSPIFETYLHPYCLIADACTFSNERQAREAFPRHLNSVIPQAHARLASN